VPRTPVRPVRPALAALAGAGLLLAAGAAPALAASAPGGTPAHHHHRACPAAARGIAVCHVLVSDDAVPHALTAGQAPAGYGPADLRAAYGIPAAGNTPGPTVAVVDAYDLPSAERDLATYRAQFGLPSCTSTDGCLTKVGQTGTAALPPANAAWGQEIALDLQMVSAACPNCRILLVEANSGSIPNLGAAVNTAVRLGAAAVSNSYGTAETTADTGYDASYYNHPGVVLTAASGDNGYGVQYPAASPGVTAVGGTTLTRDGSTRGFSETAWSGAGSGCSAYEPKPAWQSGVPCSTRGVADVAAVADPRTGVAVYDSTPSGGQSGWQVFGGTSAASPLIAALYVQAGSAATADNPAAYPYAHPASLNDVTAGGNGTCSPASLCTAGPGWDGPTGLGTPKARLDLTAAFTGTP
jgi:subtilase family serine protease